MLLCFICFRCERGIAAGFHNQISIAIDDGKWYAHKVRSFYEATTHSAASTDGSTHPPPVLPFGGWKTFPSVSMPQLFNYGHIYHHLIESAIFVKPTATPADGSDHPDDDRTLDVGTEKPMRKGRVYFKGGHVQKMFDCETAKFYFVKCA